MTIFKKTSLAASLLISAAAGAQNLNPEVEVTNTYISKFSDTARQGLDMAVPDSLHNFDYHFDYSVFESPYKGAYEFSPYAVTVKPDPAASDATVFRASLGAGWVMRPELDVVWSPLSRKKFSLSIVEKAGGWYGKFGDALNASSDLSMQYDFFNHTALDAKLWMDNSLLKINLGYDGFFMGPDFLNQTHSPFASLRLSSTAISTNKFYYDIGASYRYLTERNGYSHDVIIDGIMGGVFFDRKLSCLLDVTVVGNSYYSGFDAAPHVDFVLGPVNLRVGARISMDKAALAEAKSKIALYPDVNASVNLFKDHIQAFAYCGGGPRYNSLFSLKSQNRMIDLSYLKYEGNPQVLRVSRDRIDFGGGFKGQIASRLQYEFKGGWKISESVPLYFFDGEREILNYVNFNSVYAKADLLWHSENFDADAQFVFTLPKFSGELQCFAPSKYSGNISLKYNVKRRVFIGITARGQSARLAQSVCDIEKMPWFMDLGASLEYRYNRKLSFWVKGGNLMNMQIVRGPRWSEHGISGIIGASVNL